MKVTRENYEVFMLDYLEGNLNKESVDALMAFLQQHADLQEELSLLQSRSQQLPLPEPEAHAGFEFLKKPVHIQIDSDTYIAALEGDLSQEEMDNFNRNRALYPAVEREFGLYQQTRLQAPEMVFDAKESLYKKQAKVFRLSPYFTAIAALFFVVAFIGFLYFGSNRNQEQAFNGNSGSKITKPAQELANNNADITTTTATESNQTASVSGKESKQNTEKSKNLNKPQPAMNMAMAYELSPRKAILTSPSRPLKTLEPAHLNARIEPVTQPVLMAQNQPQYLSPAEWVRQKMKEQIPANPRELVQKTAGITVMEKKDSTAGVKSFSLVTRYFAYERITHP